MSDQDRIRLAEVIFPRPKKVPGRLTPPYLFDDFDPFTDANDCETLTQYLNGVGWDVIVTHYANGAVTVNLHDPLGGLPSPEHYYGDDYKQGVCELALKVLDD